MAQSLPQPPKNARNRLRYLRKVKIILTQRKTDEIKKITSVTAKIFLCEHLDVRRNCDGTVTLTLTASV